MKDKRFSWKKFDYHFIKRNEKEIILWKLKSEANAD